MRRLLDSSVTVLATLENGKVCCPHKETTFSRQSEKPFSVDHVIFTGVSTISDVAFRASCIPLLLLTRFLTCGLHLATNSLHAMPIGCPPRAFTKFVSYVILTFLIVSLLHLYYRLEALPVSLAARPAIDADKFSCTRKLQDSLNSLHALSQSLSHTLRRIELKLTPS
ncbi:unnamed protein product [Mesocestoides corti]|uniref:Uncharacterized protein n=1 Tax=Mesocestoides corti TaxID=53468 RepID=A0A0R3UGD9_MESCO|nr:unnamed protein product [Mesocestoides corti]